MNFIKKIIKKFFKKNFEKKLLMIGRSHLLNARQDYNKIENLNDLDYKIFSQFGEDGIIDYLLKSLNISSPKFVEIGVGDYSECNTRYLFETTQPKGMIIDCIKNFEQKVKQNINLWKGDLTIIEKKINSANILDTLQQKNFLNNLDLFVIDIDGIDYWVLKKLPKNFSKIIIVEYNATFGPELEVTVPDQEDFDRSIYHYSNLCFGASLKAYIKLLDQMGYVFVGTSISKINAFFVRKNELSKISLKDLPDINDLKFHTKSNIRESRNKDGKLNFLNEQKKINEIMSCEVIDLKNNKEEKKKISDLIN